MASSGVLYMKGMNGLESDDEIEEEEDIWDDRKLNDAYDKALKMANLEVAKRVAMATNSVERKDKPGETSQAQTQEAKSNKLNKKNKNKAQKKAQKKETKHTWKEGMACRAMYSVDGFDYEAVVLTILDDENCVIRYLGYNNTEMVPINSLQPTLGKMARRDQMMEAIAAKEEDGSSTHSNFMDNDCYEPPQVKKTPSLFKPRTAKKNKKIDVSASYPMPNMPMPEVSSMLREFGQMDMPTPPPPLMGMQAAFNDDQALSNMLVSWYMSGYYTGLYHGMKRQKQRQPDC